MERGNEARAVFLWLFCILGLRGGGRCARLSLAMEPESPHLRGCLVVFEGIDGTGKTTQIALLAKYLRSCGLDVIKDCEPTHGPWGSRVRNAALAGERLSLEEEIECLLMDRREHVRNVIEPALAAGKWVLLDRYYMSMMAYQGACGADVESLRDMNEEFATEPNLILWLDLPPEMALRRVAGRAPGQEDAFENEAFLTACTEIYSRLEMPHWHRVDANGSVQEVHARIRRIVRDELRI